MQFTKMHGAGNDYIYVYLPQGDDGTDWPALARAISHRHFGVGADGLILILPDPQADFCMRMFNADGSESEMCGTGIRCLCRYVFNRGLSDHSELVIATGAGPIRARLVQQAGGVVAVEVNLGSPRLARGHLPMLGPAEARVVSEALKVGEQEFSVTCLSMGNPHCVIFVDDVEQVDLEKWGPLLEYHPVFPNRTNVEFVQVLDQGRMKMRIWERGSGVTLSSGTGSAAAAVAAVLNGLVARRVEVELPGGTLQVHWQEDGQVWQCGPAVEICTGVYNWEAMKR